MNIIDAYRELFERDIQAVIKEIGLYENEEDLWKLAGDIKNSGGNLAMHLAGNLRHFIGHIIGKTDYQRNRDAEFASKGLAKSELIKELEKARNDVSATLDKMNEADLEKSFPIDVLGKQVSTTHFLLHLFGHLSYHLGQINYHRRLVMVG